MITKILKILRMRWDKSYVSPVDLFQHTFDASHEKSASQKAEIKKYQKIYALRDKKAVIPRTIFPAGPRK